MNEHQSFIEPLQLWIEAQNKQGFETGMHSALVDAIAFKQDLMTDLLEAIKSGRTQSTDDIATNIYPLEAALRFTANRHDLSQWNDLDPLSVKNWSGLKVVTTVEAHQDEIVRLATTQTMAKNLPLRAGFMLDLLNRTDGLTGQPLTVVELGSSAGLISTGLKHPLDFINWFSSQPIVDEKVKSLKNCLPDKIQTLGIDLIPPETDWVLACMDNDTMRRSTGDFIARFSNRTPVIAGNALEFKRIINEAGLGDKNSQFLIIVSMFLYQLPPEVRQNLMLNLQQFSSERQSLVLFADLFNIGPNSDGWFAWIENNQEIISPVIQLNEEPIFTWETVEFTPQKQLQNTITI